MGQLKRLLKEVEKTREPDQFSDTHPNTDAPLWYICKEKHKTVNRICDLVMDMLLLCIEECYTHRNHDEKMATLKEFFCV